MGLANLHQLGVYLVAELLGGAVGSHGVQGDA